MQKPLQKTQRQQRPKKRPKENHMKKVRGKMMICPRVCGGGGGLQALKSRKKAKKKANNKTKSLPKAHQSGLHV